MSSTRLALALLLPPRSILSTRTVTSRPRNSRPSRGGPSFGASEVSSYGFDSSPLADQRRDETPSYRPVSSSPSADGEYGLSSSSSSSSQKATERPPRFEERPPLRSARKAPSSSDSLPPSSSPTSRFARVTHPNSIHYNGPAHPTWKDASTSTRSPSRPDLRSPRGVPPAAAAAAAPIEFPGRNGNFQAEDLTIPMQERHPNYQKEVPVQRGGFGLGARIVKDVIGREREKEEGEVALTLHINALPVSVTAHTIYPQLIQAGLKVATCEAIVDGYRSTVIVELETDVGVRVALKKLLETTPLLKNKIEITGNLDTVSDTFTPSKRRVAISNVPLYTNLSDLAQFLHISGIHNIEALQLVRLKGDAAHSGLAFLWTREEQVRRLMGRELIHGETRLIVGVASDEPIPAQTNKSDFINGPAMKIRPARVEKEFVEREPLKRRILKGASAQA